MKKFIVSLGLVFVIIVSLFGNSVVSAAEFSSVQQERVDTIAEICRNNYCIYGVLPSVCIAQAMMESGIGKQCRGYNYWGLNQGKNYYASLESGVYAYLMCINSSRYSRARFVTDYRAQLLYILRGGYCGSNWMYYYYNCISIIQQYKLYEYDDMMPRISCIAS